MDEIVPPRPSRLHAALVDLAYSPVKLRVVLTLVLVGAWYGLVAMPRTGEIDASTGLVQTGRARLALAKDVERLRKQVAQFQDRVPRDPDPNEWAQYMISGSRRHGLRVTNLETDDRKDAGPYKLIVMRLELEGPFRAVDDFLRWLDGNPRLLRVDSLTITPQKQGTEDLGATRANLVVLGVT